MTENQSGKTEISREEFDRLVAKKRKELYKKRVIFVAIAILLLAALIIIAVAIVSLFKSFDFGGAKRHFSARTSELVGIESANTDCVYCTEDLIYICEKNKVSCMSLSGTLLWEEELEGDGEFIGIAEKGYLLVYRFDGKELFYCDKKGIVWKMTVNGEINFATVNREAEKGAVSFKKSSEHGGIIVFSFKEKDLPEVKDDEIQTTATLFEKNYSSNHVISTAISDNGKIMAIGELSESGSFAATKLSLVNIETGKTFFTKVFDKEVCPYIDFCLNDVLVMTGNKSVYKVTVSKNLSVGTKVEKICEYSGENNSVISVAVIKGKAAVVGGNVSGNTQLTIYDIESGSIVKAGEQEVPKGVVACNEYFGMYTDGILRIVDNEGNIIGSSDKFAVISDVFCSNSLKFVVKDTTGYTMVSFG